MRSECARLGNFTITDSEVVNLSSALGSGYAIDQVNLVAMHMYWFADTNHVNAEVELLRVGDDGTTIDELGQFAFSNRYEIFRGETPPRCVQVPPGPRSLLFQPSTYALMLVGLAGLGALAKRRRTG